MWRPSFGTVATLTETGKEVSTEAAERIISQPLNASVICTDVGVAKIIAKRLSQKIVAEVETKVRQGWSSRDMLAGVAPTLRMRATAPFMATQSCV